MTDDSNRLDKILDEEKEDVLVCLGTRVPLF